MCAHDLVSKMSSKNSRISCWGISNWHWLPPGSAIITAAVSTAAIDAISAGLQLPLPQLPHPSILNPPLEPKFALRLAFGALSGELAPLGRNLIPGTKEAHQPCQPCQPCQILLHNCTQMREGTLLARLVGS